MDYATIASAIITFFSPYISQGFDALAEKAGDVLSEKRSEIWDKVKGLFKTDDLTLLSLFKRAENNEGEKGRLEGKLEARLEDRPDIAEEIRQAIACMHEASVTQTHLSVGKNNEGDITTIGTLQNKGNIHIGAQTTSIGQQVFVAHKRQTYEPFVEISLIEPKDTVVLRPFKPLDSDLALDIVRREASKRRVPSLEWAKAEIESYGDEPLGEDPADQFMHHLERRRKPAYQIIDWYKNALTNVFSTYESWHLCERQFYVCFQIRNSGKCPAKKCRIQITFPDHLKIDQSTPAIYGSISDIAGSIVDTESREYSTSASHRTTFPEWSNNLGKVSPKWNSPFGFKSEWERVFFKKEPESKSLIGTCYINVLEHGESRKLRPIKILFEENTRAESFKVKSATHAENQPVDIIDEVVVLVQEAEC